MLMMPYCWWYIYGGDDFKWCIQYFFFLYSCANNKVEEKCSEKLRALSAIWNVYLIHGARVFSYIYVSVSFQWVHRKKMTTTTTTMSERQWTLDIYNGNGNKKIKKKRRRRGHVYWTPAHHKHTPSGITLITFIFALGN